MIEIHSWEILYVQLRRVDTFLSKSYLFIYLFVSSECGRRRMLILIKDLFTNVFVAFGESHTVSVQQPEDYLPWVQRSYFALYFILCVASPVSGQDTFNEPSVFLAFDSRAQGTSYD